MPCRMTRASTTVQPVTTTTRSTFRPSTTLYRMPRVHTAAARYGVRAGSEPVIGRLCARSTRGRTAGSGPGCRRRAPQGAYARSSEPANQPASSSCPDWYSALNRGEVKRASLSTVRASAAMAVLTAERLVSLRRKCRTRTIETSAMSRSG